MNATAIIPKSENPRLHRIRRISGVVKAGVLIYLIAPLCVVAFNLNTLHLASGTVSFFNHQYAKATDVPAVMYAFAALGAGLYLLGIISFYRLLCLYEKGVIFSAANVSAMKKLGSYLVGYGVLGFAASLAYAGGFAFPWSLLEIVASPWVVIGGAIFLVAWVMDEGRKIQEEQELTV
jgi:hypothetical protein